LFCPSYYPASSSLRHPLRSRRGARRYRVLGHLRRQQLTQNASSLHDPAKERYQPVHELHERGPKCGSASAEKSQLGCAGSYQHVSTNSRLTPSTQTYTDILLLFCTCRDFWNRTPRTSNRTTEHNRQKQAQPCVHWKGLQTWHRLQASSRGGFAPAASVRAVATRRTPTPLPFYT
jgi:hypothetical protein